MSGLNFKIPSIKSVTTLNSSSLNMGIPKITSSTSNTNPLKFIIPNTNSLTVNWANITGKPSCFPPCLHSINLVTGNSTGFAYWNNTSQSWLFTTAIDYISSVANTSTINLAVTGGGELSASFASMNISQFTNNSGYITANQTITLSGDITGSGATSIVTTLATVNGNVGTFGSATQVGAFTVNAKGLITAASNITITPAASSITGGATLSKTDDTNVTLTLGGSPTTALLAATSLTLGWTGTLADARITSSANWNTAYTNRITSLTTTGTSGAATLSSNTLNIPVYQAAGTYVTSVSGTANRITSSGGTTPVIDIDSNYVGQSSITTLGTIGTGTWQGSVVSPIYGGTGVANNTASTLTISGNFASTFIVAGAYSYTFPTGTSTLYSTLAGSITSAQMLSSMSDETGTGSLVFGTAPTFTTSITTPLIYGGTASGGSITIQSTTHATRGNINLGDSYYDEVNQRLYIHAAASSVVALSDINLGGNVAGSVRAMGAVLTNENTTGRVTIALGQSSTNYGTVTRYGSSQTTTSNVYGTANTATVMSNDVIRLFNFVSGAGTHVVSSGSGGHILLIATNGNTTTVGTSRQDTTGFKVDTIANANVASSSLFVVNGNSYFGANATSGAWVHIAAGTTGTSQMTLVSGVARSSPVAGDLTHITTNNRLTFYTNSTTYDIPLSDGTTTGTTVASGTIRVKINGTNYDLLKA